MHSFYTHIHTDRAMLFEYIHTQLPLHINVYKYIQFLIEIQPFANISNVNHQTREITCPMERLQGSKFATEKKGESNNIHTHSSKSK